METLIKKMLTDRKARDAAILSALILSVIAAGDPWESLS